MGAQQKPLELILARNLLASLSTPAFLVDEDGLMVFYNDAAGAVLGKRFEETGSMTAREWTNQFGPFDAAGLPIPIESNPVTQALRAGRPAYARHQIHSTDGVAHDIEVTAFPIEATGGVRGAIVVFWPFAGDGE
jgi:PAS domain-containing protein